jgi:Mob1/phocein family
VKYKRPTKLAAPDYVDALMNWAQSLLDDEAVFPNKIGEYPILCRLAEFTLTVFFRRPISAKLPRYRTDHCATALSSICTFIQQPL